MDVLTETSIRQQTSDLESLSTMSTPTWSDFSNTVSPSNDGKDGYISNGTVVPGSPIEMLPPLDSFVPIIEKLPGVVLDNNQYFVDGPLATAELEQFVSYTRRVAELVLSDTQPAGSPEIAAETFARLALIQDPKSPMLPSLERLRLIGADRSLACLFFCISPSLKSLEIGQVPSNRQITISSFLKELVLGAPHLSDITIRGLLPESALKNSLRFSNLRQLHLIDAAETLNFAFLEEAAALPELEVFVLGAGSAKYTKRLFPPPEATSLTDNCAETPEDQVITPIYSSHVPFPRLVKLTVASSGVLMGDLIKYLPPRAVKDVSLTLTLSGDDFQAFEVQDRMYTMPIDELMWICGQCPPLDVRKGIKQKTKTFTTKDGYTIRLTRTEEQRYRDHLTRRTSHPPLRQQEYLEPTILSFADVIDNILAFGELNSLTIDHSDIPSRKFIFRFPFTTFEKVLSNPILQKLKLAHWTLPSLEKLLISSAIVDSTSLMSMQSLQLPLDRNSGVTLPTLHQIAQCYPRLTYLECFITLPSGSASQIDLESDIVPHELEVLSVVGELPTAKDKIAVATFLSLLFPHLKAIETPKGPDTDWEHTYSLVKMCQTVTLAVEKRLHRIANPGTIA